MQRKKTKTRSGSSAERYKYYNNCIIWLRLFISRVHIRMLKLTVEQKCDIATRELDEVREELQRKKAGMERTYDNFKVNLAG